MAKNIRNESRSTFGRFGGDDFENEIKLNDCVKNVC